MPIYDFKCDKCGNVKEFIIGSTIKSFDLKPCDKCKDGKYEKLEFSIPNNITSDVVGGYDYTYGKKSKLRNAAHRANYLSDPSANPY